MFCKLILDIIVQTADDETASLAQGESLKWLQNKNVTPWTRVADAWKDTAKKRMTELLKPIVVEEEVAPEAGSRKRKKSRSKKVKSSDAKVAQYTQTYPQIMEPAGWHLVSLYFCYCIECFARTG